MKRIVIEKDEQTVDLSEVKYVVHPIVGASHKSTKEKAFVVMTDYENFNSYKLMCLNGFERGNHYDSKEYIGTLDNIFTSASSRSPARKASWHSSRHSSRHSTLCSPRIVLVQSLHNRIENIFQLFLFLYIFLFLFKLKSLSFCFFSIFFPHIFSYLCNCHSF